jgi:hypothetical protein
MATPSASSAWSSTRQDRCAPTEYAYDDTKHGEIRAAITEALRSLIERAY